MKGQEVRGDGIEIEDYSNDEEVSFFYDFKF